MALTQARLKELLSYNPDTGVFTYAAPRRRIVVGAVAGGVAFDGYRVLQLDGKKYRCARLAVLYMTGAWPVGEVDHIDCDKLNDRWANLRDVPHQDNAQNKQRRNAKSSTGVRGVYKNGSGYMAQARINGAQVYLGTYRTIDEAKAVADSARKANYSGFVK